MHQQMESTAPLRSKLTLPRRPPAKIASSFEWSDRRKEQEPNFRQMDIFKRGRAAARPPAEHSSSLAI